MDDSSSNSVLLAAIYTLTPTHCGTGATSGAVDLPIARESHTDLPILPASGLKGAIRSRLRSDASSGSGGLSSVRLKQLFGPDVKDDSDGLSAGTLAFTEGHLLAYPMRSLSHPWLYVTAPCLLERLNRDHRALTAQKTPMLTVSLVPENGQVLTSSPTLAGKPLMLEDFLYPGDSVLHSASIKSLANQLADLLPEGETDTRSRLQDHLVVICDAEFMQLIQHAIPVQARIKLNERKTTTDDGGNLWYEEQLPSDCLFTSFVLPRPGGVSKDAGRDLKELETACADLSFLQLGGNETVGQGMCWWHFHRVSASSSRTGTGSGGTTSGGAGGGSSRGQQAGQGSSQATQQSPNVSSVASQRLASPPPYSSTNRTTTPATSQLGPLSLSSARQRFLYEKLRSTNRKGVLSELNGLPVQLRQAGLNVTLLDLLRRGGPARTVADWLSDWLMVKAPMRLVPQAPADAQGLLGQCILANRADYQALQAEAGLLLEQAKRLAQSLDT